MSRNNLSTVESTAADWLTRRDRGFTDSEKAEFDRWCEADPAHARAVAEIDAVWAVFDEPKGTTRSDLLRIELDSLRHRERRRWVYGGTAATLAAACLVLMFQLREPAAFLNTAPVAATARVEVPARQTLPDGSVVELRAGATITVVFAPSLRRVLLNHSEAHFSVVKDPSRPFVVDAGGVQVRAVGTAFSVQRGQGEVEVVVTEGQVAVRALEDRAPKTDDSPGIPSSVLRSPSSDMLLTAGDRVVVPLASTAPSPVENLSAPDLNERLAWRLPRLDLSETTVAEAVALFNQHSGSANPRLIVGDDTVAAHRLTGLFRSDNVEGFVRALESTFGVKVERRDGEMILRSQ